MKKITDSFIKNIVRQSLNENRRLLNEAEKVVEPCPRGGFCLTPEENSGYNMASQFVKNNPVPATYTEQITWMESVIALCNNEEYSKGAPLNETTVGSIVTAIQDELDDFDIDHGIVKKKVLSLGDFPSFCVANETSISYGQEIFGSYPEGRLNSGMNDNDDYKNYVVIPVFQLIQNSINISKKQKITYDEELAKLKEKYESELKKSGWATRAEWEAAGWKPKPIDYTVGGGGTNKISFEGYECLSEHPALIKTPVKNFPDGVGYKLDVTNQTIKNFIFGVQKQGTGDTAIDQGVMMKDDGSGIAVKFNCPSKYLQYSLSTNVWNYSAALDGSAFDEATDKKTIVLTTDPDLEDDSKSNKSIQFENIKGFRYNLLTEVELKYDKKKFQTGPDVVAIQTKLGISTVGGYGPGTKAAVEKFQKDNGLPVTGDVDETTYKAIMALKDPVVPSATGYTRDLTLKSTGPDVVAIQTRLGISTKGGFGGGTEEAVKSFQKKYKLPETGVVDKTTFDKIMAMPPAGTAAKYSGKKHNYTEGQWIKVSPKTDDSQLSGNNGYFKITQIVNEYSVAINATFVADGPGGSTQRVLFGEDAKQGTQEVIKSDGDTQDNSGTGRRSTGGDNTSGRRSGTGGGTVDPEKQRQRDIRNKEYCSSL